MSKEQLALRLLCADARIDAHKLRTGKLNEKDWARLAKAYTDLSQSKLFIDDSATISPLEMRAKCRRLKAEFGLGLVIVDYLQLVTAAGRVENRQQELSAISRSAKGLAKELACPVLALSQLSRAPEARTDRRPQLSDLRESGALEQDADIVMFIYREEEYKPTDENRGIAEIIIGKQRNGLAAASSPSSRNSRASRTSSGGAAQGAAQDDATGPGSSLRNRTAVPRQASRDVDGSETDQIPSGPGRRSPSG
jgi:replicative DNA helicase